MLTADIRKVDVERLMQLEDNRILLPITIDNNGENVIEIIPHKARAGYLSGYSDPEFIEGLQHISLPFLKNGKFRAFPVSGDSMPPHKEGSFIIGRYIESIAESTAVDTPDDTFKAQLGFAPSQTIPVRLAIIFFIE